MEGVHLEETDQWIGLLWMRGGHLEETDRWIGHLSTTWDMRMEEEAEPDQPLTAG